MPTKYGSHKAFWSTDLSIDFGCGITIPLFKNASCKNIPWYLSLLWLGCKKRSLHWSAYSFACVLFRLKKKRGGEESALSSFCAKSLLKVMILCLFPLFLKCHGQDLVLGSLSRSAQIISPFDIASLYYLCYEQASFRTHSGSNNQASWQCAISQLNRKRRI